MTGPDEPAPATEAEGLVDAYVKAIVDGAHVPHGAREDLTEELFGHIAERIRAHAASGLSVAAATQRAIDDFGGAEELAGAFGRTFHSALWASTIGVLLAGVAIDGPRPGAIRWLRLMMAIAALFMAGGAIVFGATATPVVAVSSVVAYLYAFGACALAYRALGTGQRWSLWYAIAVAIDFIVSGVWMVVNPATRAFAIRLEHTGVTATNAHAHRSAVGVPGPVVIPLTQNPPGVWTSTAGATLTDELFAAFMKGELYLNVHSAAYPGGEIRGQLMSAP